ncbi:tyrosine-type recombinase/integrase (plasmid) [Nocardiopsis flavescens]|nr:tyrosine-type recombinase/integrase [Nocardiopsis flavescens]
MSDGEIVPVSAALPAAAGEVDDDALTPAAAARVADGWAPNTKRAIDYDWTRFADWCAATGRRPLPATGATLASYVTHLMQDRPAPATIERALGIVQTYHKAVDLAVNGRPARMALRSYRREWAAGGGRVRRAAAVDVEQLTAMLTAAPDGLAGLRDRTLLLLGFTLMARRSELASLDIGDVRAVGEGLEVFIASSKTDKDAVGATSRVPYGTLALTCAVRTTQDWIGALAEHGLTEGPLLRGIDRYGRPAGTPGATLRGTGRMSGAGINLIVQRLAAAAGLEGVTAHSLRAGPATAAAMAGVPRAQIVRQGRWAENSTAVDAYIRPAEDWEHNPMRRVGL